MIASVASELLPDRLFYRAQAFAMRRQEPELRRLGEFVPSDRPAIDVGAWWGPWTYWLSRGGRRVTAVEPQPRLADFLRRVAGPSVDVKCIALSDAAGSAELVVPGRRRGQDALAHIDRGTACVRSALRERVDLIRLDDLGVRDVGFIKIDVEGHERAVVAGAQTTIARDRPSILVEIEQRHLGDVPIGTVFDAVTGHGYTGFFLYRGRWRTLADFDVVRDQLDVLPVLRSKRYVNNFVFVPEESSFRPTPRPAPPATTSPSRRGWRRH